MTRLKYLAAFLVAVLAFCIYLPSLHNGFVNWDDDHYVYENPHIQSFGPGVFSWAFTKFYAANWHPLTWISHSADILLWGLNPEGHHLTNIIIHSLNTFLVVLLAVRLMQVYEDRSRSGLFSDRRLLLVAPVITGLLFGLHPLHVESVAWVSERKDLLCAFFFLLSIIAYTGYAGQETGGAGPIVKHPNKDYLLALIFFLSALLSKPMAVTLPLVLLIIDWFPFGRFAKGGPVKSVLLEKVPFFVLSLASSIITILAQKSGGAIRSLDMMPIGGRIAVGIESIALYLVKMVFPANLVPFYPYPKEIHFMSFQYLFPAFLVAGATVLFVVLSGRRKIWIAAWAYYVITLLPVLGIIQVGRQEMADRYTYLPSIGPFLVAGLGAAFLFRKCISSQKRAVALPAAVFIFAVPLFLLSYKTVRQEGIWKDSLTFWDYVIRKQPGFEIAYYQRALVYAGRGDIDRAIHDLRSTLAIAPDNDRAHNNLGCDYLREGRFGEAFDEFNKSVEANKDNAEAWGNLAVLYLREGNVASAVSDFKKGCGLGDARSCDELRKLHG